jgi:aerobic carbon-monoxide dehydrogenase medium subunit
MYAASFDYQRPTTIDEAIALLAKHGDDAKVLAGGHSLIPAMKLRLARPRIVIDIARIANLSDIRPSTSSGQASERIAIGALATHRAVETSALLKSQCPLLAETAAVIGDVQVRNKGTIGGSLVHADPAADYPAAILALDAEIEVAGPHGRRTIRAADFFVDLLQTSLAADEILTEVRVSATPRTVAYVKTEQKASGFALAGVAVVVGPEGIRIGVTGVAATAYRAAAAEQLLAGQSSPSAETIALAAARAADGVDPLSDIHASAEFRAHLARVNTRRAIEKALARA